MNIVPGSGTVPTDNFRDSPPPLHVDAVEVQIPTCRSLPFVMSRERKINPWFADVPEYEPMTGRFGNGTSFTFASKVMCAVPLRLLKVTMSVNCSELL